jgi:hypothetical protein
MVHGVCIYNYKFPYRSQTNSHGEYNINMKYINRLLWVTAFHSTIESEYHGQCNGHTFA